MSRLTSNVRCKPLGLARWFDLVVISCIPEKLAKATFIYQLLTIESVNTTGDSVNSFNPNGTTTFTSSLCLL
jgi:hypothetical protein